MSWSVIRPGPFLSVPPISKSFIMKNLFRLMCLLIFVSFDMEARAQVPILSSYPSASAVIFLDFDGHTVNATSWNYAGPIVCGSSGLSNEKIVEVFNRVAEDYRPFNINITTDSTKYLAAPMKKRMRVIITTTYSWYSSSYGGVAFNNSFIWGDDNPCFVFSSLLVYNSKYIAEAAAHEAGHTLGLDHQASYNSSCVKLADYHTGTGSGEIGWAPIMGVGYYRNFTLWNNGPNMYGCNVIQNDLEIITSTANGFGYRSDDHGNSYASATLQTFSSNQFTASGVIEKNTDQDIFKFVMPYEARFQLNAIPYNVGTGNSGSDLDMQVTLFDASQNALNIYNPGTLLNSLVDTVLDGGTYYVKVEGKGNIYAPAYASLGSYSLQGNFAEGGTVLPLRRFELQGSQNGDLHQLSWVIDADETVLQQILEVSTDGRNFTWLAEPSTDSRSHTYRPGNNGTKIYRVKVEFDNGHYYYTNAVTLREMDDSKRPRLLNNPVTTQQIKVSSPGKYSYMLIDMSGKIIMAGQLGKGLTQININQLNHGMYLLRIEGDNQKWTEKIIKE
jgi:hypothetical protein